ncbi:MAG: GWxTD domain-containing protein [Bacteroidota bacterium]|nr:GWxTD domain-containing protein [Bacteroidota bacterium]
MTQNLYRNKINISLIILFTLIGILISCETNKKISNQNVAFLYKREAPSFNPEFSVLHKNDSISELHFKISSSQVLYARPTPNDPFSANISLSFKVFDDYEARITSDTASIVINDVASEDLLRDLISSTEFKAFKGFNYIMEVTVTDINRNKTKKTYITVEKNNLNNRQNFLLQSAETGSTLFKNHISNNRVQLKYSSSANKAFVRYYNREFEIAPPPFVTINHRPFHYKADSLFELPMRGNNILIEDFKLKGFYHIQVDSTLNKDGYTLYHFNGNFPEIKAIDDMLNPLRYITSKQEFDELFNAENKKEALDKFWLNLSGSKDRARELISIFYNRVQDTNLHFTSYIEGWMTDRGMIYIIFGPPNVIYKSVDKESWIYGEDQNMMSINFNFYKVENPFSSNDYSLERSVIYKTNWYRAVDLWRQGRIF